MGKYYRRKQGYFTMSEEVNVDVRLDDVVDNLSNFSDEELKYLKDSINKELSEEDPNSVFGVNNLEDEFKVKILKEMFHKYSWEELDKIKNLL